MKGQLKFAMVLFGALLLLGGLATWDEWKTKQEKEQEKTKNKLVTLAPDEITRVAYDSVPEPDPTAKEPVPATKVHVELVKQNGSWRLTAPVQAAADSALINEMLKTLTDYAYTKVIADSKDKWSDYGLTDGVRQITVASEGANPRTATVVLGAKAPVGYNLYLRSSADDRVFLGSQHLLMSTSKTVSDFRDKSLVKIDESKVATFAYTATGQATIEAERADSGYSLVKPEALKADSAAIRDFLEEVSAIRVTGFVDSLDEATRKALANPTFTVSWKSTSGEPASLAFADVGGKLLAALQPAERAVVLPDELRGKLKKDLIDFRDRRVLPPSALTAKTLTVDGTEYENIDGSWYAAAAAIKVKSAKVAAGDQSKGNAAATQAAASEVAHLRAFMVDLEFAKTDQFLAPTAPEVVALSGQAPLHRLSLTYQDPAKQPPLTLELFEAPSGMPVTSKAPSATPQGTKAAFLVRISGMPTVYRIAKSTFASMTPPKAGAAEGKEGGATSGEAAAPAGAGDGSDLPFAGEGTPTLSKGAAPGAAAARH